MTWQLKHAVDTKMDIFYYVYHRSNCRKDGGVVCYVDANCPCTVDCNRSKQLIWRQSGFQPCSRPIMPRQVLHLAIRSDIHPPDAVSGPDGKSQCHQRRRRHTSTTPVLLHGVVTLGHCCHALNDEPCRDLLLEQVVGMATSDKINTNLSPGMVPI